MNLVKHKPVFLSGLKVFWKAETLPAFQKTKSVVFSCVKDIGISLGISLLFITIVVIGMSSLVSLIFHFLEGTLAWVPAPRNPKDKFKFLRTILFITGDIGVISTVVWFLAEKVFFRLIKTIKHIYSLGLQQL